MGNLTIQQFCQLETLKEDLQLEYNYKCREKFQKDYTVLEITDSEGNLLQELIIIL